MLDMFKVYATGGGKTDAYESGYGVAPGWNVSYTKGGNKQQGTNIRMGYNRAGNAKAAQIANAGARNPRTRSIS